MRTTIELPDELLREAKSHAALSGLSLKQFFIQSIQQSLAAGAPRKTRKAPPVVGDASAAKPVRVLTAQELDEALFG